MTIGLADFRNRLDKVVEEKATSIDEKHHHGLGMGLYQGSCLAFSFVFLGSFPKFDQVSLGIAQVNFFYSQGLKASLNSIL